jgi:transcriptional regulator with XRE-family HTH domain
VRPHETVDAHIEPSGKVRLERRSLHPAHVESMARAQRPHRKAFAENLVNLRIRARLTQPQVAERMGKVQATYSKWETGYGTPKLHDIVALCVALGCTPNQLFEWAPARAPTMSQDHDDEEEELQRRWRQDVLERHCCVGFTQWLDWQRQIAIARAKAVPGGG